MQIRDLLEIGQVALTGQRAPGLHLFRISGQKALVSDVGKQEREVAGAVEAATHHFRAAHAGGVGAARLQVAAHHLQQAVALHLLTGIGRGLEQAHPALDLIVEAANQAVACVAGHLNTGRMASMSGSAILHPAGVLTHHGDYCLGLRAAFVLGEDALHSGLIEPGFTGGTPNGELQPFIGRAALHRLGSGFSLHRRSSCGDGLSSDHRVAPGLILDSHRGVSLSGLVAAHNSMSVLASSDQRHNLRLPVGYLQHSIR